MTEGATYSVFLSYRRSDAGGYAGWLRQLLAEHFPDAEVFRDVDALRGGEHWVDRLDATLARCNVLVAVIGPDWLRVANEKGRRLDDPEDLVRLELEAGIRRGVPLIPALVGGAKMPVADELPRSLVALHEWQAVRLSDESWLHDVDRLVAAVERACEVGPGELQLGARFAGHRIEALIGRGGMGVVYRARHLGLNRVDAIKVIAPDLARSAQFRERFVRESHLAASVRDENVVTVYDAGKEGGLLYLTMQLVDGIDLGTLLARCGRLSPELALELLVPVAAALEAAHEHGLVHRDIKPGNVLIEERPGRKPGVYLGDFGLAREKTSGTGLTSTGHWIGTADYVSPEQVMGEDVDGRADVYALGCVLFEMLSGRVPFPARSETAKLVAHATRDPPSLALLRPELSAALDDVVRTAMARSPDLRYQSAASFSEALRAAVFPTEVVESRTQQSEAAESAAAVESAAKRAFVAREDAEPPAVAKDAATRELAARVKDQRGAAERETPAKTPAESDTAESKRAEQEAAARDQAEREQAGRDAADKNGARGDAAKREAGASEAEREAVAKDATEQERLGRKAAAQAAERERAAGPPRTTSNPRLDGSPRVNRTLTVTPASFDGDEPITLAYQWQRRTDDSPEADIEGATEPRFVLSKDDAGHVLRAQITATNTCGSTVVTTPWSAAVAAARHARRQTYVLLTVASAIVAIATVVLLAVSGRNNAPRGDGKNAIHAGSRIVTIHVGNGPDAVTVGQGGVWVANYRDGTVTRIDPSSGHLVGKPIQVGRNPAGIAVGRGSVWVANNGDGTVTRIDPSSGHVLGKPIQVGGTPAGIAVGQDGIWVATGPLTVTRINATTGQLVGKPIRVGELPYAIALGQGGVWVANEFGTVTRIDPSNGQIVGKPIRVGGSPQAIAVGQGGVWVANEALDTVTRIDPSTGLVVGKPIQAGGSRPLGIAAGQGGVWVTNNISRTVTQINPGTGQVVGSPIDVGRNPAGIAVGQGSVWVANSGDGTVTRIDASTRNVVGG